MVNTKAATLAAARKMVGIKGIPNAAWPLSYGNYCMASVGLWVGIRSRGDLALSLISIDAFRHAYHWPEYPLSKAQQGDLVLLRWESTPGLPDHIGLIESVASNKQSVVTIEGNTGPKPGVAEPNGFYRRTRYAANIVGVIRPPYAAAVKPAPKPAPAPAPTPKPAPKGTFYVVVKGDNLSKIAAKYKTTVPKIVKLNGSKIKNPDSIQVGWKIRVR